MKIEDEQIFPCAGWFDLEFEWIRFASAGRLFCVRGGGGGGCLLFQRTCNAEDDGYDRNQK